MSAGKFQALPHSEETERAVLAAILLHPGFMPMVASKLTVADFYLDRHQAIFAAMAHLSESSQPIDLRTLQARLELQNTFELVGGLAYLTGLDLMLPDLSSTMEYVGVVKERSVRRQLMKISANATDACLSGGLEGSTILGEVMADLQRLAADAGRREPRQIHLAAADMAKRLREQAEQSSPFQGFFTGLRSVDSLIVGLERKNLSLWIADPGAGKTAWSLQVAEEVNLAGGRIFYASLEMSEEALSRRLACRALRIPIWAIARGELSIYQLGEIDRFVRELADRDFMVDDATKETASICARIRGEAAKGCPPDLVVVDYLQLAEAPSGSGSRGDADWKLNGINAAMLRAAAVEVNAHVLVLGQANEKGKLLGGGGWQEADLMVRIERPWVKTRDPAASPEERNAVNLVVLKNRLNGPGDVGLEFDGGSQTFREPAAGNDQLEF